MLERSSVYPQASALRPQTQECFRPLFGNNGRVYLPPHPIPTLPPPNTVMVEIEVSNVLASQMQRVAATKSNAQQINATINASMPFDLISSSLPLTLVYSHSLFRSVSDATSHLHAMLR